MAWPVGSIVFWTVLASTPLMLVAFSARKWGGGFVRNFVRMVVDYRWHLGLFMLILVEKNWIDSLNDPIRGVFGDKTWLIHRIEGDATYHIQTAFEHPWLTDFLNVHYLWIYVFLNYFSVILFAYQNDRELASMAALNYSVIYVLAIPFYIFFNIQITSDSIPGMKALLYHSGPGFYDFFVRVDPLDNAFPSLHMAIPFGLLLCMWWTMRRRGYTPWNWEHRAFLWFVIVNTSIFAFSILYLGIHWLTDIPGGMLIGLMGATIAEEFEHDFQRATRAVERGAARIVRPIAAPLKPLGERVKARFRGGL